MKKIGLTTALVFALSVSAQQPQLIVSAHRPVAAMLDRMEPLFGMPVNYEDAPYVHQGDLEDVATPEHRARYGQTFKLWVPKKGTLSLAVGTMSPSRTEGEKVQMVETILSVNRSSGGPGDFALEQANGFLYVVPASVSGPDGRKQIVSSVLKAEVSFPTSERSVIDTVQLILESAGKSSRQRIVPGQVRFPPSMKVNFGVQGEPARDALARLFKMVTPTPLSYRLLYDPALKLFMFNLQSVSGDTPSVLAQPITAQPPTGENPFFQKTP